MLLRLVCLAEEDFLYDLRQKAICMSMRQHGDAAGGTDSCMSKLMAVLPRLVAV